MNTGRRWYLVAWDEEREAWRTFRVDRIDRNVSTGGRRFQPRELPSQDLATYVSGGGWSAMPCRARVKVFASADAMAERLPGCVGLIEPIDDSTCYFETGSTSYERLALHLLLLGVDFEIREPQELIEEVRQISLRHLRCIGEGK